MIKIKEIYLDHAATTSVRKEVLNEMLPYYNKYYGNPSSNYLLGRENKNVIEYSRNKIAKAINANKNEIYFTSCGSESDNLAIKGFAYKNKEKGNHIITSKIEHPAVLNTCKNLEEKGFKVTYLDVDEKGFIEIEQLKNEIKNETILISIMMANNEIGTIQDIKKIGEIAHKNNIVFHTDAVQAVGNIKIDVNKMNIDMLSMSGHKFYAPKGIGALYIKEGIEIERIQDGGHQEKNKRAGTENVAGIVGIGKAIELIDNELEYYNSYLVNLRNYCIELLKKYIKDIKINGDLYNRLPGNISVSFKNVNAQDIVKLLDKEQIYVSSGSACSSGCGMPSHVLKAIKLNSNYINGTIRISLGKENTRYDIEYLIYKLIRIINYLRNK